QVNGSNGDYYLNQSPIINFNGQIGFGIVGFDQQLSGGNKNGIYSIELILDDKPIYTSVLERFAFEDSRAINSHIDYPALISYKRIVQKSFVEPGNPLNIYKNVINSGLIELGDDEIHRVKYVVKDTKGNISTLNFRIKKNSQAVIPQQKDAGIKLFVYADSSNYLTDRMRVAIPKGSLYDNINFNYSISNRPDKAYSVIHNIHTRNIPVHKPYYLWIKPDVSIPEYLREKALITDSRGASHGGEFDRGFIRANPKSFGSFYVQLDTVAPLIRPVNISDGKSMSDISKIVLKMTDNLSGISSFSATIDGHWVLFEYDAKTSTVWHTFDEGMNPGKHFLQFTATDMKKNIRTYNATFIK
ncbi:MAG TPA: M23 family peptidase, partial [Pedobacter sp.]